MTSGKGLRIGPKLWLPLDLAVEATAIVGKRGRGKTFTGKRLVEQVVRAGVTVLVIDPTDVWWGLRSGADGQEAGGLDVVTVGGSHDPDLPVHEGSGKMLARLVLDGTSIVLSPKGLVKAARRRLVGELLAELYDRADGTPILVVIDEADEYAPEGARSYGNAKGDPLMLASGAVEDIVRRGRAGGLGSLLITQRVAVLSKNVLEQSDTLIALGVTGKNDIDAVASWIAKHAADTETGRQITASLPGLPRGTAWVWAPEHGVLEQVEVLPIETFDSSRSPRVGEVAVKPKGRKSIDLDALGEEMARFAAEVKADDPAELKRQIADLKRQLTGDHMKAAEADIILGTLSEKLGRRIGWTESVLAIEELAARSTPVEVPVPVLAPESVHMVESMWQAALQAGSVMTENATKVHDAVQEVIARIEAARQARPSVPAARTVTPTPPRRAKATGTQPAPARPATAPERTSPTSAGSNGGLKQAERKLLTALCQRAPLNYVQLGLLSGYSHTSSHFDNTVSSLRTQGLIEGTRSGLTPTAAGRAAIPDAGTPVDDRAMLDHVIGRLKQAERILFTCLLEAWPGSLDYPTLGERSGYSAGSSHFDNTVSRLRKLDLISGTRSGLTARNEFGKAWAGG